MDKTVTLELKKSEVDYLLEALQSEISTDLDILRENDHQPHSELFVIFLEAVHDNTDIYIKLRESIKETEEEQ